MYFSIKGFFFFLLNKEAGGVVTKIEVQSSYTVAHIKTYNDIFHPKTFFLINDAKATLTEGFDSNNTRAKTRYSVPEINLDQNTSIFTVVEDLNVSIPVVSSIPNRIDQTQEDIIEAKTPLETYEATKPKSITKPHKPKKPKRNSSSLDLF